MDLDGAKRAATVGGMDAGGGVGIGPLEFGPQFGLGRPLEFGTQIGIDRGPLEESLEQRLQIEVGSADHDRDSPAGLDPGDGGSRGGEPVGDREVPLEIVRIRDVEQVVGHRAPFGRRRLGGADVEPPVDLHAVGGDALAETVERRGEFEREFALPACGRAEDEDRRKLVRVGGVHRGGRSPPRRIIATVRK